MPVGDGHSRENETELKLLGMADGIVSLNSVMTDWLHDHDINVSITNLNVWDYDNPNPINPMLPYTGSICFAGNLDKSTFLTKYDLKHKLLVLGAKQHL